MCRPSPAFLALDARATGTHNPTSASARRRLPLAPRQQPIQLTSCAEFHRAHTSDARGAWSSRRAAGCTSSARPLPHVWPAARVEGARPRCAAHTARSLRESSAGCTRGRLCPRETQTPASARSHADMEVWGPPSQLIEAVLWPASRRASSRSNACRSASHPSPLASARSATWSIIAPH